MSRRFGRRRRPGTLSPNSAKYRVASPPAATGRAGNATLAARALLNKDGSTDVDITTGQLDSSATAPGNISKAQIKTYNGAGDVQWTKNYNSLTSGGTLHYNFADLHHGQPIQVQTNVDKIDKRTDVVTVTGNVKLRPDLAVRSLTAPARAKLGSHVDITAVVQELNADVGATGDCKLLVDGTQVDQALGIYVDAHGTVSCAFNYQFNSVGTHALQVTVDGVVPADYDTSNNSQTGSIEIFDDPTVTYNARAWSWTYTWNNHDESHYPLGDGTYASSPDWSNDYVGTQHDSGQWLQGWSPTLAQFPLQSVSVTVTSDGTPTTLALNNSSTSSWGDSSYGSTCEYHWNASGYEAAQFCSYTWNGSTESYMWEQRSGGDVTYHSQGYDYRYYYYWYYYDYSWNYDTSYTYGDALPIGTNIDIAATWVDAAGTSFAPHATFATQPFSSSNVQAFACYSDWWYWGAEQYCYSRDDHQDGVSGYTSGTTN